MKNKNFWKNKTILITGHTGFKGSWMTLVLKSLGANVVGYALNPISKPNFFDNLRLTKFLKKDYRNNILDRKKGSIDYAIKGPHLSPEGYKKVAKYITKSFE